MIAPAQLAKKVEDKKFISFMVKRLNYDYVDNSGRHIYKYTKTLYGYTTRWNRFALLIQYPPTRS
jgi:hypothetical protein